MTTSFGHWVFFFNFQLPDLRIQLMVERMVAGARKLNPTRTVRQMVRSLALTAGKHTACQTVRSLALTAGRHSAGQVVRSLALTAGRHAAGQVVRSLALTAGRHAAGQVVRSLALTAGMALTLFPAGALAEHPAWQSRSLLGSPEPPLPARTVEIFPNLVVSEPIGLLDLPGRDWRLIVETRGKLKAIDSTLDDPTETIEILDLAEIDPSVAAIRDMTLDPEFEVNGFVYLVWGIRPSLVEGGQRVSRFVLADTNPPTIDPSTRLDVFTYPSGDHVGASLRFGRDGYLYIGTGDGSGPNPPDIERTAQDLTDVRGSILRIDVRGADAAKPNRIPPDNPFVNRDGARPEIYSLGIRNAFRIEFDPSNGNLWVADVGWVRCEMLHRTFAGANHGWSVVEGPHEMHTTQPRGPGEIVPPVLVLPRAESQSITGGVFQSVDAEFMPGSYLFGDYMNGAVWAADLSDPASASYAKIADSRAKVVSFAQIKLAGQTSLTPIVIDHRGRFLRLETVPADQTVSSEQPFPLRLSETGLFGSLDTLEPAPGVARYQPVATQWRDGAVGDRVIAVPTSDPIQAGRKRRGTKFPMGTVFANTLTQSVVDVDGHASPRRMETQLLVYDGLAWNPFTYRWNDEQTDASLVPAFGDEVSIRVTDPIHGVRETQYRFMARDQCKNCHHASHGGGLSFTPQNLLAASGPSGWAGLVEGGWVNSDHGVTMQMVDPSDAREPLERRARSYLEMNCGSCHAPSGAGLSKLDWTFDIKLDATASVDEAPLQGTFGLVDPMVIVAGHPERSVMMYRMATSGHGRMPHVGSEAPDLQAINMIWDWIASMDHRQSSSKLAADRFPRDLAGEGSPADTTSASLLLWRQLLEGPPQDAMRVASERLQAPHSIFEEGLFSLWVDPSQRALTIGNRPDVADILSLRGDARQGASWFSDVGGSQCRACHRRGGVGIAIGPDLDGIGQKRTREHVVRSLLYPSEEIDPPWRTRTALLADGTAVTGWVTHEDESTLVIKSADGRLREIALDEIDELLENTQSVMPEGQLASLTAQQVADLVEFLMQ